jgi:hypothetical protein
MKGVLLAGVAAVVFSAGACSNATNNQGESATEIPLPDELPLCSEVYAAGNVVELATFGDACRADDDTMSVPRPAHLTCSDGRELLWNEYAWGYKDTAMQLWEPEEVEKVPTDEALECLQQEPGSAPAGTASGS